MVSTDCQTVLELLKRSSEEGIKISLVEDNLTLKFQNGKEIQTELLNDLKLHKNLLLDYFNNYKKEELDKEIIFTSNEVKYGMDVFYKITPVELYWVNPDIDKEYKETDEAHGMCFMIYEILGKFDLGVFKKAINYLINRHESLRTTFHLIEGEYLSKIENVNRGFEFVDLTEKPQGEVRLAATIKFEGHKFDFEKGPLFLIKVIKLQDKKFILSMKAHHVIMDTLSEEVLLRDLYAAYKAFSSNGIPHLPILQLQYKEHLALRNFYIKNNYESHKGYWDNIYTSLPEDLIIPGAKNSSGKINEKICKTCDFNFSQNLVDKLDILSQEFSVSRFVILQAVFNFFLCRKTGQYDIVIGTYVFGRQYAGLEDQIGCYAKTALIRTIFNRDDTFFEFITKVKKSNEEMQTYDAYTLLDVFKKIPAPAHKKNQTFAKVNLQYNDFDSGFDNHDTSLFNTEEDLTVQTLPKYQVFNRFIARDMQLQFFKTNNGLHLHVQYDSGKFNSLTIKNLMSDFLTCLDKIDQEKSF